MVLLIFLFDGVANPFTDPFAQQPTYITVCSDQVAGGDLTMDAKQKFIGGAAIILTLFAMHMTRYEIVVAGQPLNSIIPLLASGWQAFFLTELKIRQGWC